MGSVCSFRPRLPSGYRGASPAPTDAAPTPARAARCSPEAAAPTYRVPSSMKAIKAEEEALHQSLLRCDFKEMLRQFEGKPALWQDGPQQQQQQQPLERSDLSATQQEEKLNASLARLGGLLEGLQAKVDSRGAAGKRRSSAQGRGARPPVLAAPPLQQRPSAQQDCPPCRAHSTSTVGSERHPREATSSVQSRSARSSSACSTRRRSRAAAAALALAGVEELGPQPNAQRSRASGSVPPRMPQSRPTSRTPSLPPIGGGTGDGEQGGASSAQPRRSQLPSRAAMASPGSGTSGRELGSAAVGGQPVHHQLPSRASSVLSLGSKSASRPPSLLQ